MSLTTPVKKARGLGSAKDGVQHFWMQRLTAIALIPLGLWFAWFMARNFGVDYESARFSLMDPWTAGAALLFVLAGIYHMKLGLQVIVEDYVHGEGAKLTLIVLNTFVCAALASVSGLALLAIYVGF